MIFAKFEDLKVSFLSWGSKFDQLVLDFEEASFHELGCSEELKVFEVTLSKCFLT